MGANICGKRRHKQARGAGLKGLRRTWGVSRGRQDKNRNTGGGGRRYWTSIQVDRQSNNGREGGESGTKIEVQISLRVEDGGGGFRTRRVMGKEPVNS